MGTHMKTTVEIRDDLFEAAKESTRRRGTTLRALIERGLERELEREASEKPFRIRDASYQGRGLRPEVRDLTWEELRNLVYEGRGD